MPSLKTYNYESVVCGAKVNLDWLPAQSLSEEESVQ